MANRTVGSMTQADFRVFYVQHIRFHISHVVLHGQGQLHDAFILRQHQAARGILAFSCDVHLEHLGDNRGIPAQTGIFNFLESTKLQNNGPFFGIHLIDTGNAVDDQGNNG